MIKHLVLNSQAALISHWDSKNGSWRFCPQFSSFWAPPFISDVYWWTFPLFGLELCCDSKWQVNLSSFEQIIHFLMASKLGRCIRTDNQSSYECCILGNIWALSQQCWYCFGSTRMCRGTLYSFHRLYRSFSLNPTVFVYQYLPKLRSPTRYCQNTVVFPPRRSLYDSQHCSFNFGIKICFDTSRRNIETKTNK